MVTYSEASAMVKRGRNGRKRLQNNTYLERRGEDFAVRLHYTDVVTIHADGTFTLRTGGWETVTTKDRINGYGPARVYSQNSTLAIWSSADPRTPVKMQKCRVCHGSGSVHIEASYSYGEYRPKTVSYDYEWGSGSYESSEYVKYETPRLISEAHDVVCYRCDGTGQQDYGSKPMPVVFFDGIRVDGSGHVLDADGLERLNEPAEVKQARHDAETAATLKRIRNAKRRWLADHKVKTAKGVVYMYKAVHDDFYSAHGALYTPNATVTADDYRATSSCGAGLHFSPTVDEALSYDHEATRFLLCAVDRATFIPIDGDKGKARSCRVLYEVGRDGERLPVKDPISWSSPGYRE